jgi:hypothetical protein
LTTTTTPTTKTKISSQSLHHDTTQIPSQKAPYDNESKH